MRGLAGRRIDARQRLDAAAVLPDGSQAGRRSSGENDSSISSPACAASLRGIGNRERRPAGERNRQQFAPGEEADASRVGREEGRAATVRSVDEGGVQVVQRSRPDAAPCLLRNACGPREARSIGGNGKRLIVPVEPAACRKVDDEARRGRLRPWIRILEPPDGRRSQRTQDRGEAPRKEGRRDRRHNR